MMLQANPESTLKPPRKKMETPKSDRAKEIAKSREEMLSLLHDMPESDYELSLTDIVDRISVQTNSADKEMDLAEKERDDQKEGSFVGERNLRKVKERRRSISDKNLRCSSDGVLLNFYTPALLTRSLTTPRGKPMMSHTNSFNCTNRENDRTLKFMGCWSLPWDRRWRKSKRLNQGQNLFEFDNNNNKKEENSKSLKK